MAKKLAPNYVGIDPMTGLPVSAPQKELNLSTELADFTRTGRLSTPQVPSFATTPIDATSLEDFQELPKFAGWSQGEAEDVRAEAQSWYSSLGNGIARLGLTTGTKLLSGVSSVGDVIMNSAASLALDEDVSGATPLSGLFDSMEEAIKEAFPVYNTRADQRKNFLHRAVTDLDFWTNDMVDGAAFMISAYLTGMGAAKLLGPATKALYGARLEAAAATEAAKIAELESAIAAGNQAAKAELIGTSLVKGNLAKNMQLANNITVATASRTVESIAEGKQTYNQVFNSLVDQGYSEQEAGNKAAQAAMAVTGLNMLLTPLDYQQYSGWFKTFSKSKSKLLRLGETGALEVAVPSFGKAFAKQAGKNAFSEGILEEGLQYAMQEYANKKYVEGVEDNAVTGVLKEYFDGFTKKEGWDAMGAGMILGGLFGGVSQAYGQAGKQTREQAKYLQEKLTNNEYLKENMADFTVKDEKTGKITLNKAKILGLLTDQVRDGYLSKEMVTALSNDYEEAYKALDNIRFGNWAYSHFEAGRAEDLYKKIEDIGSLDYDTAKQKGIVGQDLRNSEGRIVTPTEIAERYKQKALEYEKIYNQINSRFEIPNRKVARQLFEEAVLQKETITSIDNINNKITDLKGNIYKENVNTKREGTPVEELETPEKGSEQEKELNLLTNRKKDLINTLKDSNIRVNKMTIPSEIEKEKLAAQAAKNESDKDDQDANVTFNAQDREAAQFYNDHKQKVFKDQTIGEGPNAVTDDFVFAENENGEVNPNILIGLNSGKVINIKDAMPFMDVTKAVPESQYRGEKTVLERLKAVQSLIDTDDETQLRLIREAAEVEQNLMEAIAKVEELQGYKVSKDGKLRKGFTTKDSKVYTLEEYQKLLDDAIALRDLYQEQLDNINKTYEELDNNIRFLKEYQEYLLDPKVTAQEKLDSLQAIEEGAIQDMYKLAGFSITELERMAKDYGVKAEAITQKLGSLDNLIKAIQDIITRKKFELAVVRQRLSEADTFERFLMGLPEEIVQNLYREDFETLRAYKRYGDASPLTRTALAQRASEMLNRNPDLVLAIIEKAGLLETELKDLEEQLSLSKAEMDSLSKSYTTFMASAENANNAAKDLRNIDAASNTLGALKDAFSKINVILNKTVATKKTTEAKANKESTRNVFEPDNLTDKEFEEGVGEMISGPVRDIFWAMNATRGNNMLVLPNGQFSDEILTDNPDQRRWFAVTENLDPAEGFMLRPVTQKTNPFGRALQFKDVGPYKASETILLVLYYKGNPIKIGDDYVYTSMGMTPTFDEISEGRYTNNKNYSEEALQAMFTRYEAIRKRLLSMSEEDAPLFFKVTGKSAGVRGRATTGNVVSRLVETAEEIDDVQITVVRSDSENIGGTIFSNLSGKRGFVLIGHKNQVVPVSLPTMEEIPGAVDFLMQQVNTIAQNFVPGEKSPEESKRKAVYQAENNIKALINYGNYEKVDFKTKRIFLDKKEGKFVFNGQSYDLDKIPADELRAFFQSKLFNVNLYLLNKNEPFTDPLNNKEYPSYKHYLMSSEGRTEDQVPVKVTLAPLAEQQFLNVYLKFDSNSLLEGEQEDLEYAEDQAVEDEAPYDTQEAPYQKDEALSEDDPLAEYEEMLRIAPDLIGGDKPVTQAASTKKQEGFATTDQGPAFTTEAAEAAEETTEQEEESAEKQADDILSGDTGVDTNPWEEDEDNKGPFKLFQNEQSATKAELDAEEAWFKKTFPQFANDYKRIRGLIQGRAVGQVTQAGKVLISDLASPGTTYHEAFHKVSLFLLENSERERLYDELRKRLNRPKLSAIEAEEILAESFRNYMITGDFDLPPVMKSLFQKIVDLLKALIGVGNTPGMAEALFENIKAGNYANKPVLSRPTMAYNKVTDLSIDFHEDANQVLTSFLINSILRDNFDIDVLNNLHKIDLAAKYNQAFEDIKATFRKNFVKSAQEKDVPPADAEQRFGRKFTNEEWVEFRNSYLDNLVVFTSPANRNKFIKNHMAYMAQFGLMLESNDNNKDSVDQDTEEKGPNAPDWIESVKFSPKQNMTNSLKFLMLSLTDKRFEQVGSKQVIVANNSSYFGVPKIANFDYTMNFLQDKLAGSLELDDMVLKMHELSLVYPPLKELMAKLKMSDGGFSENLTLSEVLMQLAFVQQFAKTKNEYLLTMISPETGEIYQIDATSESLKDKMVSIWKAKSKQDVDSNRSFYKLDGGKYVFKRDILDKILTEGLLTTQGSRIPYNANDTGQNLYLLKMFGIPMTRTANQYTIEERKIVNEATSKIIEYFGRKTQEGIDDMFMADAVKGRISQLAAIDIPYTKEAIELSHMNPEGETVYSITLNNYLSNIVNEINSKGINSLAHLKNDVYSKNSIWKKILQKNQGALKLVVLEGQKINEPGQQGEITSNLSEGDLTVTHINALLNNVFPLMRAGDKKLEYGFQINMDSSIKDALNIFKGYLADELERVAMFNEGDRNDIAVFQEQGGNLVTFYYLQEKGIILPARVTKESIPSILADPDVTAGIQQYIANQQELLKEHLLKTMVVESKDGATFKNNGISTKIARFPDIKRTMTLEAFDNVTLEITLRHLMGSIEQSKLFLGDLAFYNHAKNDGPKRVGGLTGTKRNVSVDPALNKWLSQTERADKKTPNGKFNIAVFEDPILNDEEFIANAKAFFKKEGIKVPESFWDPYKNIEFANAQGYITLPEYREFLIRSGQWSVSHDRAYPKVLRGGALTAFEVELFQPLKPQYFGPQTTTNSYTPTFLKFSLVPLLPRMIKGTKLEQLNKMMMDNSVGVATFGTGAKIGAIINKNYLTDNNAINSAFQPVASELDYKYFGIQVDIAPESKYKVTFGTQFRKLLFSNMFIKGKGKNIRVVNSTTGNLETVNTEELGKQWDNAIEDLTKIEMESLLKKLNVTKKDGGYLISDPIKFKEILMREAEKRGASLNIRMGIDMAINNTTFNLDVLANKTKIEFILSSLINNNLIRQKTFGDMKVQMSSFGTAPTTSKKSSELKSYEVDTASGKVRHIQVKLPHWFKDVFGRDVDIKSLDKRLLNIVGYRIPTQDYSSMDVLEVVEFLPPEQGNVVIIPENIPAKGGSDFDIDKMNLLIPNYKITYDTSEALSFVNTSLKGFFRGVAVKPIASIEALQDILTRQKDGDSLTSSESRAVLYYKEFMRSAPFKLSYVESSENSKEGKQNKLIEIATQVLTSPDNYKYLIRANTNKTLLGLSEEIAGKPEKAPKPKGKMLEFVNNIKTALAFWTGKGGVGVAALHNSHHSLSQKVNLYVPAGQVLSDVNTGFTRKSIFNKDIPVKMDIPLLINFNHNQAEDGGISFADEMDVNNDNRISDLLAEFINAYVDIAKDPFILKLNAGIDTANIWLMLIRAGVNVREIAYFMSQPIIKDYFDMKRSYKSQFLEARKDEVTNLQILREVLKKYELNETDLYIGGDIKTEASLKANMTKGAENKSFNGSLIKDLLVYEKLANDLSDIQKITTFDTAGVGKTRWQSRALLRKVDSVLEKTVFKNAGKILDDTLIKSFYNVGKMAADVYNEGYVLDLPKAENVREFMFEAVQDVTDVKEQGRLLSYMENEFLIYLFSKQKVGNIQLNTYIKKLFTGENSLAHRLGRLKQDPDFQNNFVISNLIPIINPNRTSTDNIRFFDSAFNSYQADLLFQGFEQLFNAPNDNVRVFASDLMVLMLLQGGPNLSPVSLYGHVPNNLFIPLLSKAVIGQYKNSSVDTSSFGDEFYMNNWHKNEFVPWIPVRNTEEGEAVVYRSSRNYGKPYVKTSFKDKNGNKIVKLYKLQTSNGEMSVYKEVPKRGNGFYLREYFGNTSDSVIKDNVLVAKPSTKTSKIKTKTKISPVEKKLSRADSKVRAEITKRLPEVISDTARKYLSKEQYKSRIATQYIGEGSKNSSTDRYKILYQEYGIANTGKYSSEDIVWVSSNGKRTGRVNPIVGDVLQGVYKNVDKVIKAKGKIIMDTAEHLENTKSYNVGELALAVYLNNNGYVRNDETGMWSPKDDFSGQDDTLNCN